MRTAPPNRCTGSARPAIRRRTCRVDTLSTSATSLTVKNLSAPASALPADTRPRAALKSWSFNLSRELIATSLNWKVANEAKELVAANEAAAADFHRPEPLRGDELVDQAPPDAELLACTVDRKEERQLAIRGRILGRSCTHRQTRVSARQRRRTSHET